VCSGSEAHQQDVRFGVAEERGRLGPVLLIGIGTATNLPYIFAVLPKPSAALTVDDPLIEVFEGCGEKDRR
jgi:hypothetical protein